MGYLSGRKVEYTAVLLDYILYCCECFLFTLNFTSLTITVKKVFEDSAVYKCSVLVCEREWWNMILIAGTVTSALTYKLLDYSVI